MSTLQGIERVVLVEDEPAARRQLGYNVALADLTPVEQEGPVEQSLDVFVDHSRLLADAGVSDFHLSPSGYASFNGAELVASWYKAGFPAILCTRFEKAQIESIRPFRRHIPVLVSPDDLTPETLETGLRASVDELRGNFTPERRPWRAQVHFLEQDADDSTGKEYFVELPGWARSDVIRVHTDHLPMPIRNRVAPDRRFFAKANIGAESAEDIYIADWELEQ